MVSEQDTTFLFGMMTLVVCRRSHSSFLCFGTQHAFYARRPPRAETSARPAPNRLPAPLPRGTRIRKKGGCGKGDDGLSPVCSKGFVENIARGRDMIISRRATKSPPTSIMSPQRPPHRGGLTRERVKYTTGASQSETTKSGFRLGP
jgi:hypothetical protein